MRTPLTKEGKKFEMSDLHVFVPGLGVVIKAVAQLFPSI